MEEIGKKIAKTCKGLPLSIAVIGGLLAKSERTRQYWEYIADNLNPIVNLEDEARCLKILSMSYFNLPVHLKPCFLYMGVFNEDMDISVSRLVRLWVAEGFLKPISGKCLEAVAEDYLKSLMDRNLISVHRRGSSGKIKYCKIHDLLRDLCLREAHKEKFSCVPREHSPNMLQSIDTERCITIHSSILSREYTIQLLFGLQFASLVRSLIYNSEGYLPPHTCRLLRVLQAADMKLYNEKARKYEYFVNDIFQFVNLRYLDFGVERYLNAKFHSSKCLLWNLQTLIINGDSEGVVAPSEIWMMPHLRHVKLENFYLPDPPSVEEEKPVFVLRNLQTLSRVINFGCSEDVVKRIPNIKKLRNLTFPYSLRKLALCRTHLGWEEMSSKVGSLPLLQVLKLKDDSCTGSEWKPVEGQFCSLKVLEIQEDDLEYWTADETNFPCLEQLLLLVPSKLKEKIADEQEELGNLDLQVQATVWKEDTEIQESMLTRNFQVAFLWPLGKTNEADFERTIVERADMISEI
ncbi:hypothetical protein BUALT_Bualt07G0163700 [Buddleja alternifolia]|uniref:Disease resistance protein winged helix domain-containing protein n=1 Tax=Buddleja alternifolia TaxID=168488 RepID=A0AAV6XBD6_9LAMI|nr:hypothetical protein BUALT_Bualt07G0163700 [Buddleja alternifolia]